MTHADNSASGTALISPEAAGDTIYRALCLFIGQGRRFSCDDIEAGTGIPARNVSGWIAKAIENRRRPKAEQLLVLQQFIGIELTNKLLAPIGQGGRHLEPEANSPGMVMARLTGDLAKIAGCGASGRWNHTHTTELEEAADDAIAVLTPLSSREAVH